MKTSVMEARNESTTTTEGVPMDTLGNTAAIYVRRSAFDAGNKFAYPAVTGENPCLPVTRGWFVDGPIRLGRR